MKKLVNIWIILLLTVTLTTIVGAEEITWDTPITSGGQFEGYCYLTKDVTGNISVGENKTLHLNLNGYSLTGRNSDAVISVYDDTDDDIGGTLHLYDTNVGEPHGTGGTITGGTVSGVYVGENAHFTMYGGTISGNKTENSGGGVYVFKGFFDMIDGTIQNNEANNGGGVSVFKGTFTMEGGTIQNNTATDNGGGVYVYSNDSNDATFNMTDGTIAHNKARFGGGVCVNNAAQFDTPTVAFNMEGGTIQHNEANYGGGVYVLSAIFDMDGGTIAHNDANVDGGGVYVNASTSCTITDSAITNNTALGGGGGVYNDSTTINFSGKLTVTGNTVNGAPNNAQCTTILSDTSYTISGALDADSQIGITQSGSPGTNHPFAKITSSGSATASNFTSDSEAYVIKANDDETEYYLDLGTVPFEGDGTETDPYQIATAEQLQAMGTLSENTTYNDSTIHYQLTDDITLDDGYTWFPLRSNLDGQNHSISGNTNYGVFSQVTESITVQNINLHLTITATVPKVGALAGTVGSGVTIEHCHNYGDVTVESENDTIVGGLVGESRGTIQNCSNAGTIQAEETVGGIVGDLMRDATITDCTNTGTIISTNDNSDNTEGDSQGDVDSISDFGAGGIAGVVRVATVTHCTNTGTIESKYYAGGIVACTARSGQSTITKCANRGTISGEFTGGVIGLLQNAESVGGNHTFHTNYNTGAITGSDYAGGVVGKNSGTPVKDCYNVGTVSAPTAGGVVGWNAIMKIKGGNASQKDPSITTCYTTTGTVVGKDDYKVQTTNCYDSSTLENMTGFDAPTWHPSTDGPPTFSASGIGYIALSAPSALTATPGSTFNPAGLVIEKFSPHGTSLGTVAYNETDFAFNPGLETILQEGMRTITITYQSHYTLTLPITVAAPPSSGGGSSSYTSSVATATNGTVTIDKNKGAMNGTITITPTPDQGYAIGTVTVTYASGREVTVTDNGDGTFSYKQPGAGVKVTVTFVPLEEIPEILETTENSFTDVTTDNPYYDGILWAVENGITTGYDDGTFGHHRVCTRAQSITFLWRAAGSPVVNMANPFTDLSVDDYYYQAVLWAVSQGITAGTSDTTFAPGAECNRSQIVTFLWRANGAPVVDYLLDMDDVSQEDWCAEAIRWSLSEQISTGYTNTTFRPQGGCNRGQIVTFLYRDMV